MNEGGEFMEVQVLNDSSSEDDDGTPTLTRITAQPSPANQSPPKVDVVGGDASLKTPVPSAGTMMIDVRPNVSKPILIRPTVTSVANGSVPPRATLVSGSPGNFKISVKPSNQLTAKTQPSVKWTQAVNRSQTPRTVYLSSTAGQNQMITSSGTGSPSLGVLLGGGRQLNKTLIVNPSGTGLAKAVSLIPGYLTTGTDGQTKIVGTTIVQQKGQPTVKSVNMLNQSAGKIISSPQGRCVTVQANQKFRVIGSAGVGPDRRVMLKPSQNKRPLEGQPVVSQPLVITTASLATSSGATLSVSSAPLSTSPSATSATKVGVNGANISSGALVASAPTAASTAETSKTLTVTENCEKIDLEAGDSQNPSPFTVSDSQDSNATTPFDSQTSICTISSTRSSRDEKIEADKNTNAVAPTEKKPIMRKATILSGTKPKLKKSLLNGVDAKKPNAVSPDVTSLPSKSIGFERIRKRKDNHKPSAVGEPPQKLLRTQQLEGSFVTAIPGADNLRAITNVVKWDGVGLGMLPGSTLRFTRNFAGMLEVHEPLLQTKMEFVDEDGEKCVKPRDPQEIYCCVVCSCYGLLSEFNSENFCSGACYDSFQSALDKISSKLLDEPMIVSAVDDKKAVRRKLVDTDEKNETVPAKQKKTEEAFTPAGDFNQDNAKKAKPKSVQAQEKTDDKKPGIIKLKSMDFINASQSAATGRQLRTRESLAKKPISKYVAGQDLEGEVSDDDEKIKNENVDPFPWSDYLVATASKPAWIKLFTFSLPTTSNPFKIGFKLEAIDPERQGLFCAATVADVQGHRLKIHFDGYANKYDFWTNIDSPNIFECGFCERHGFTLQPPCGMKKNSFNWATYQTARKVRPCHLSWFRRNSCTSTNMFRPGMKLEAVDKKNTQLTCVATCVGVLENRILVHFDSWSDVYDYWVDTCSPYIHPVGWCKSRNRELTPPNYHNPVTFSWDAYLKETKSDAAPLAAFTLRPPLEWKKNTKLEAIDRRAPHILRVATIKDVLPYQIKIAFDGFPDHFGYWVDDDCPDIHPINWGLKTGHQLTGPPEPYRILSSSCTTPGCVGDGNWRGLHTDKHTTMDDCPYSNVHLHAESPLQDRMADRKNATNKEKKKPPALGHDSDSDSDVDPESNWKFLDEAIGRACPKGRLAADGTLVQLSKRSLPFILPTIQNFRSDSPASSKSASGQAFSEKTDDESSDRKQPGKRFERRGSDRSLDPEMTSQENTFERKLDKNLKGRRSLPAKAPIQTASPAKGRVGSSISIQKSAKVDATGDVLNRIRTKVGSEPALDHTNILSWTPEQCSEKVKDLPPKCQASLKKLELTGERFLLIDHLFGTPLFDNLVTSESTSLRNTLKSLQKGAVTGLGRWKACKANSRWSNSSLA